MISSFYYTVLKAKNNKIHKYKISQSQIKRNFNIEKYLNF